MKTWQCIKCGTGGLKIPDCPYCKDKNLGFQEEESILQEPDNLYSGEINIMGY
jgi:hypothetical protein